MYTVFSLDYQRAFLVQWGNPGGTKKDRMHWLETISTITLQVLSCPLPSSSSLSSSSSSPPLPSLSRSSASSFSSSIEDLCQSSSTRESSSKSKTANRKTGEEEERTVDVSTTRSASSPYTAGPLSSSRCPGDERETCETDKNRARRDLEREEEEGEQRKGLLHENRTRRSCRASPSSSRHRSQSRRRRSRSKASASQIRGTGPGGTLAGLSHLAAQKAWKHLKLKGMHDLIMSSSALQSQKEAFLTPQMELVEDGKKTFTDRKQAELDGRDD